MIEVQTQQERALAKLVHLYGPVRLVNGRYLGPFSEDHINYRRVGITREADTVSAIGRTWQEAMRKLRDKAA